MTLDHMSNHAYTEDQLVEQPAIGLFAALGWQTVSALEETFGMGGTLGRDTKGGVALVECLHAALRKFNPVPPPKAMIGNAIDDLTLDLLLPRLPSGQIAVDAA